jgi:epoxyqueuosine reductase
MTYTLFNIQQFFHVGGSMSLTQDIKEFALLLGYSKVGITTADPYPEYAERINARGDSYNWLVPTAEIMENCCNPQKVWPEAKSVIILVLDYFRTSFPKVLEQKVGRAYLARAYTPPKTQISGARRQLFIDFLAQKGVNVNSRVYIPERLAAARAGVVTFGKNNFVYLDGASSFIIPTAIVVDKELEYDKPTMEVTCPPDCTRCIDACPTKALYAPLKLNPRLCIAFNNCFTQDNYVKNVNSFITPEIREKIGTRIYGCDICQDVCPRNQAILKTSLPSDEFLEKIALDFDLRKVLNLTDEYYNTRIRPIMYNYIKEKKYFQRNAAIALGNTKDTQYIADLEKAMEDPEPIVRGYAAWGLGRIGGFKSKIILETYRTKETDNFVLTEIQKAL